MDSKSSLFRLSATQPIACGRTRPMLKTGLRGIIRWFLLALLLATVLPLSIAAQSPEPDPRTAGSDIVGKLMPVRYPASMVRIPAEHKQIMEANLQRFVAIVLSDPSLQPPVGFDFRTGTHAYAPPLPVSLHAPLAYTMTGLFYWYTYMPACQKIQPLDVAMQGFFVRANDISAVFNGLERWELDEQGLTYLEPKEIRKVAGFPQYSTGVVVLKRNPRPIWVPVSRERELQFELAQRRKNLDAIAESAKAADVYDPTAILEKWLGERPERQREMEKSYAEMKQSNPEYAEKIRASFFDTEKQVEKALRYTAEHEKAAPSGYNALLAAERSNEEKCIRYLEDKLARLSPAERAAPAYISLNVSNRKQSSLDSGCSCIVDADFPDARRLVTENPDYYDQALPPSAIQLILVDFSNFEGSVRVYPPWRHAAYERIRDGLDYSALAAMLQE
jgi:hypothetical protein